jgi:hypothetical protein
MAGVPLLGWPPPVVPYLTTNLSGIGHDIDKLAAEILEPFVEVDGYREHYTADGSDIHAVRYFDVPWSQRDSFVSTCLGYSQWRTDAQGRNGISRKIPFQHPERPYLYASRVELLSISGAYVNSTELFAQAPGVAMGGGEPNTVPVVVTPDIQKQLLKDGVEGVVLGLPLTLYMAAYLDKSRLRDGLARFAVTYTPRNYEVRSDAELDTKFASNELARNVSRQPGFAGQNLPFPNGSIGFAKDPGTPTPAIGGQSIPTSGLFKVMGITHLAYTHHDVPDIPWAAIQAALGSINSVAFDGLAGYPAFPAKTLLCNAPTIRRRRNAVGRYTHDITHNFSFRNVPWTHFPAIDGNFYRVTLTEIIAPFGLNFGLMGPGNRDIWPLTDFNALFAAAGPPASYQ